MRVPIPSTTFNPARTPDLSAPRTVAFQDQTGEQMQQLGQGVAQLGTGLVRYGGQLRNEFDQAKAKQADNLLADVHREALESPQGGYLNTMGEQATGGSRKRAFDMIEQKRAAIRAGLLTEEQRTIFDEVSTVRLMQSQQRADRHESRQVQVFNAAQSNARWKSFAVDAANTSGTPDFDGNLALMMAARNDEADVLGVPEEQRKLMLLESTTDVHRAAIDAFTQNGDSAGAAAHLKRYGDQIDPFARKAIEAKIKDAGIDEKSFEVANWASAQSPRLLDQIASVDEWAKGKHLDVAVRDKAVIRLRAKADDAYQQKAREGNEVMRQAQEQAGLGRVRNYELLPAETRESLEKSGRSESIKLWMEQGNQFVTTNRGLSILQRAEDVTWLRGVKLEDLVAASETDLSPTDARDIVSMWHKANAKGAPKNVGSAMVGMTLRRKMQVQGFLPIDRDLKSEETARYAWVLEQAQRQLGPDEGDQGRVDKVIDSLLAETITVDGDTKPIDWFTDTERQEGVYKTDGDDVPRSQVSDEIVKQRLAENQARNAARREWNMTAPPGQRVSSLAPEDTPGIVRQLEAEARSVKARREKASLDAMKWLRANRDGAPAWDKMPQEMTDNLTKLGVLNAVKLDWEIWDRDHDFLGRRNQPDGPMQRAFGSPWGR